MYCSCRPPGERVQMVRESYPEPQKDRIIYKWLCCACGYTQEYTDDTTTMIKAAQ